MRKNISEAFYVAICTYMGDARNNINVLSSDVVIACAMGAGTASEVALALKAKYRNLYTCVLLSPTSEQEKKSKY